MTNVQGAQIIKAKCILHFIEELHAANTDNSGKKSSPMYDTQQQESLNKTMTVLCSVLFSHRVTVTDKIQSFTDH